MKTVSSRLEFSLIGSGYGLVILLGTYLVYLRHLAYVAHAADVDASSGMWAAGDAILGMFLIFLFMVPTIFLVRAIARFERLYAGYSTVLLVIGLTAPLALAAMFVHGIVGAAALGFARLSLTPFALLLMAFSRWVARSDRSRRLISCALLLEGATCAAAIALLIRAV